MKRVLLGLTTPKWWLKQDVESRSEWDEYVVCMCARPRFTNNNVFLLDTTRIPWFPSQCFDSRTRLYLKYLVIFGLHGKWKTKACMHGFYIGNLVYPSDQDLMWCDVGVLQKKSLEKVYTQDLLARLFPCLPTFQFKKERVV